MPPIRLMPFSHSSGIQLVISDVHDPANGTDIDVSPSSSPEHQTTYDAGLAEWTKLTARLTARISASELRRIARGAALGNLIVSVTCAATKFRKAVRLEPKTEETWVGFLSIVRKDFRGAVHLRPMLVTMPDAESQHSHGNDRWAAARVVADGAPIRLVVDPVTPLGTRPVVSTVWEDFAASENPWRRENAHTLYHLEPHSEPRLFLNARYAELREILDSEAASGAEAAVRDLVVALIAHSAWLQLGYVALHSIDRDVSDEPAELDGVDWRHQLLRCIAPGLYPDASASGYAERIRSDLDDGAGMESLASRLGTVVQTMCSSHKSIEGAIRALEAQRPTLDAGE